MMNKIHLFILPSAATILCAVAFKTEGNKEYDKPNKFLIFF